MCDGDNVSFRIKLLKITNVTRFSEKLLEGCYMIHDFTLTGVCAKIVSLCVFPGKDVHIHEMILQKFSGFLRYGTIDILI